MDRTRRASGLENETWSNPCDYDLSNMSSRRDYKPELAEKVANQVQYVLSDAMLFKEEIASLHSYPSFDSLLKTWKETEWLRNHSWFQDEMLPKWKDIGQPVTNKTELDTLMMSENIDKVLKSLTKAMKMLGRSLNAVSNSLWDNDPRERALKPKLNLLSNNIRYILCLTSDVLRARKLDMLPLYDSEVPTYTNHEAVTTDVFLIYRDTINFLEYIDVFFTVMNTTVLK